jgi:hypothetical protein
MLYPVTYNYSPHILRMKKIAFMHWQQAPAEAQQFALDQIRNRKVQLDEDGLYQIRLPNGSGLYVDKREVPALTRAVSAQPAAAAPGTPPTPGGDAMGAATKTEGGLQPGAGETQPYDVAPAPPKPQTPTPHPQQAQYQQVRQRLDYALKNFAGAFNRGVHAFNPSMKAIMTNLKRADESIAKGILPEGYIDAIDRLAGHLERAVGDATQNMQFLSQLNQYVTQLEGFFTTGQPVPQQPAPWVRNQPPNPLQPQQQQPGFWGNMWNRLRGASSESQLTAIAGASPRLRSLIAQS